MENNSSSLKKTPIEELAPQSTETPRDKERAEKGIGSLLEDNTAGSQNPSVNESNDLNPTTSSDKTTKKKVVVKKKEKTEKKEESFTPPPENNSNVEGFKNPQGGVKMQDSHPKHERRKFTFDKNQIVGGGPPTDPQDFHPKHGKFKNEKTSLSVEGPPKNNPQSFHPKHEKRKIEKTKDDFNVGVGHQQHKQKVWKYKNHNNKFARGNRYGLNPAQQRDFNHYKNHYQKKIQEQKPKVRIEETDSIEESDSPFASESDDDDEPIIDPEPLEDDPFEEYWVPIEPPQFDATIETLYYYEPGWFHFIFGTLIKTRMTLPRSIIRELNLLLVPNVTTLSLTMSLTNLWSKPYIAGYLSSLSQDQIKEIKYNSVRYLTAHQIDTQTERSRAARTLRIANIKHEHAKKHLDNKTPFLTWREVAWTAGKWIATAGLIRLGYVLAKDRLARLENSIMDAIIPPTFSILWWDPKLSLEVEEGMKTYSSYVGLECQTTALIAITDGLVWRSWKQFFFHFKHLYQSHQRRRKMHAQANARSTGDLVHDYNVFVHTGVFVPTVGYTQIQLNKDPLMSRTLPLVPDKNGKKYIHTSLKHPEGRIDSHEYENWWALCWCASPMVKPANSLENYQAAIDFRLNAVPNSRTDPNILEEMKKIIDDFSGAITERTCYKEWYKSLNPKQKLRIERVKEALSQNRKSNTICTTFVKSDESINALFKSVPRIIFNVAPWYLLHAGRTAKDVSKLFSKTLCNHLADHKFATVNGIPIYVYYTSGATSNLLNAFIRRALKTPKSIFLMVMGDDTLCVNNSLDQQYVDETDFEKFDRTQNKDLISIMPYLLRKLNLHYDAAVYEDMYKQKISFWHKRTNKKIKVFEDQEFVLTGEPYTSLGNSIRNALISSLAQAYNDINIYEQAGVRVKHNRRVSYGEVTYLKGVFLKGLDDEPYWIRLPSFLCKFGKTFTLPTGNIYPKYWKEDKCIHQFVWSQWLGYGNLKVNWFYERIHNKIKSLCSLAQGNLPDEHYMRFIERDSFREQIVLSDTLWYCHDDTWNSFMMSRYKITVEEMEDFLSVFENIPSLPIIYYHPLVTKLLERDY